MEIMDKQKSKFGVIEIMPNQKIFGYVNVNSMTDKKEIEIISDYIDMGYLPLSNKYILQGGSVDTIDFKYLDEFNKRQEGSMPYVNHGIFIMKTELKKHVPIKDK